MDARIVNAAFISTMFTIPSLVKISSSVNLTLLGGVTTKEDALNAISYGVTDLKFYPAHKVSPSQLEEVLQDSLFKNINIIVAGNVKSTEFKNYIKSGAHGFAIGIDCSEANLVNIGYKLEKMNDALLSLP